ncbi:MAG: hypothetical protein COA74_10105 [Gammaproteobacteria bacterium]|nr:MAG: hypothetical protein COA74_10105 [Gammaproteobacteria bacterium]
MNRRLVLNVMIIALLTFYMIFNIVYNRVLTNSDDDPQPVAVVWEQYFLVPNPWQLVRLEFNSPINTSIIIQLDETGNWFKGRLAGERRGTTATLNNIANSWKNLQAGSVTSYELLPLEGMTVLAFVREDSQPLVYRVVEQANEIQFFRMIDKKLFSYPITSRAQFIPDLLSKSSSQSQID